MKCNIFFTLIFSILQGLRVENDPESGVRVLAGGKNLVLQGIQRFHSGNFTCTAFNLEGEDTSNVVEINVMCKYLLQCNYDLQFKIGTYFLIL